ncbi:aspartate aminotransferase family protein [Streptomyces sp. NPDC017941]|uniref:aspartate aminotransferase family protein n=1 Tax=Streptomyces sp. NPDC017941 TaxID=3365018 RepID=UPI00378CB189
MAGTPPLRLDATDELLSRGQRHDAWMATFTQGLDFDTFTCGTYPRFAAKASGSRLWDPDGNEYIDYILGYGTVLLGHAHPKVLDAVTRELANGTCASPLWRPVQVELTQLLTSVLPNADLAYLMRTGSDATAAAVRLARLHTGRKKVLQWGYHGWHEWSTPRTEGLLPAVRRETLTFEYNDLPGVRAAFEQHGDDIACVIMMPFETDAPESGFLHEVRRTAHAHGALFILDELRSGFRMALGGAQEYFGVDADLVTVGKGMANGHPLSAVAGREDVMRGLSRTHMESTFFTNSAEMAAALATVTVVRDTDALRHVWRMGERLLDGFRVLIAELDVPVRTVGYAPMPFLEFTDPDPDRRAAGREAFFRAVVRRGVFFEPDHHWFISAAHTEDDIDRTLEACREGFLTLLKAGGA